MKKIFALALVIVMMAAISIPVFAAEIDGTDDATYTNQTYISYGVTQTYTVVIPPEITVNPTTLEASCPVAVKDVCIPANEYIKLSVTSRNEPTGSNAWQLVEKGGATGATPVPYTVANSKGNITRGAEFMSAESAVNFTEVSETLTITVTKTMQVATFEDYLTFSVAIEA